VCEAEQSENIYIKLRLSSSFPQHQLEERVNVKVLGINTSPRKKNTYRLIEMVMEGITRPEIDKEIITLSDYKNFNFCLGDCACLYVPPGNCVQKDDVQAIQQKIVEADGFVLGSPVYIMQVSAHLKNLIDRCVFWAHRPPLVGSMQSLSLL
jgi:multimeric flavodoxin WrbA